MDSKKQKIKLPLVYSLIITFLLMIMMILSPKFSENLSNFNRRNSVFSPVENRFNGSTSNFPSATITQKNINPFGANIEVIQKIKKVDEARKELENSLGNLPKFENYEFELMDLEEAKILYVLTPELKERINSIIAKIQKKYKCSSDNPKIKWYLDTIKHLKERKLILFDPKSQKLEDNVPPDPFGSELHKSSKWKDYLEGIEFRLKL